MSSEFERIEDPEAHIAEALEDSQEVAYNQAKAGFEFPKGNILYPYSPSRRVAAQSMGMLYPFVSEAAAAQQEATGLYAGQLRDMIILLWVCSQKDAIDFNVEDVKVGAWSPGKALNKPEQAMAVAMEWAERVNLIDTRSEEFRYGLAVFMAIVCGVDAAEFKLKLQQDTGPTEDESAPEDDSKKV